LIFGPGLACDLTVGSQECSINLPRPLSFAFVTTMVWIRQHSSDYNVVYFRSARPSDVNFSRLIGGDYGSEWRKTLSKEQRKRIKQMVEQQKSSSAGTVFLAVLTI